MSLKARIEAVIYAAEEPVTLAQLAALFGPEALEQKQARETELASEATAFTEAGVLEAEEAAAEATASGESSQEFPTEEAAPSTEESAEAAESSPSAEAETQEPVAALSPEAAAEAAAAEEKRVARQREREIRDELRATLDELIADYAGSNRGMEIREVAGGYRVGTKPEYHDSVRAFVKSLKPPIKLSLQALETLAVIAYKQPVTAPEIGEIRGVDSAGVIGSLLARKLVATAGRKQVIGRPILYKTTKEFLLRFGLKDLNELPSMEEFEKMAGELGDGDADESGGSEQLPFTGEASPGSEESEGNEQSSDVSGDEPDQDAEPVAVDITVETESEIEEDLPGVEIDPATLDAEPEKPAEG